MPAMEGTAVVNRCRPLKRTQRLAKLMTFADMGNDRIQRAFQCAGNFRSNGNALKIKRCRNVTFHHLPIQIRDCKLAHGNA